MRKRFIFARGRAALSPVIPNKPRFFYPILWALAAIGIGVLLALL
jgi:hypothetical protein